MRSFSPYICHIYSAVTNVIVIRLHCFVPTYLSQPSLICDFCPSDQRFAYSFLQIPPHDVHPCCSAIHFPLSGRVRVFHPLERAHGTQTKKSIGYRKTDALSFILHKIQLPFTPSVFNHFLPIYFPVFWIILF